MRPRLIGPERLTIQPIARSATVVDELAGEPVGQVARLPNVVLLAQVDELRDNDRNPGQGGARIPVLFTVTFRRVDVDSAGYTPRDGDRVIERAGPRGERPRALNLYVVNASDSGEILSGRSLVEVDLTDRAPSRWPTEGGP